MFEAGTKKRELGLDFLPPGRSSQMLLSEAKTMDIR